MRAGGVATALVAALALGGCVGSGNVVIEPGTDPVAGWYAETREVAGESWLYAQLASNSYEDASEEFILPGDIVLRHVYDDGPHGYAYSIYDRFQEQELVETIIAYRGTEPSADDWLLGNVFGWQNEPGLATAKAVAEQLRTLGHENVAISVTGHSLGGAIAHYVSLRPLDEAGTSTATSVVFNNSPRFSYPPAGSGTPDEVERIAVAEHGEWLSILRPLGPDIEQTYQRLNCRPGLDPFGDHSIRALADCLTWVAAFDTPAARFSRAENPPITRPVGQLEDGNPPPAETLGRGIPVNPYIADTALLVAVDAELRASDVLSPYYEGRAGFRLEVLDRHATGTLLARWYLNGVEQQEWEYDCRAIPVSECAEDIVKHGASIVPRPRPSE